MWLDTEDGPAVGLHLGMTGRIIVDPEDSTRWDRFTIEFEDGGPVRAPRQAAARARGAQPRLLRRVGPDAAMVGRDDFRRLIGAGKTAIKARLLNQRAISGIGNLLADQILWQARISPLRSTSDLSTDDLDRLRRELRSAVRSAIRKGGAHTGNFIEARRRDGACPRDGHQLERDTVGGRTTYWCPACQR